MKAPQLEIVAQLATTIAALVAIVALVFGFIQFKDTHDLTQEALRLQTNMLAHEREAKAIDLFIKFNELQEDAAARAPKRVRTQAQKDELYWREDASLAITESIFLLTKGDAGWRATTVSMLERQKNSITSLNCPTFAPEFVAMVHEVMKRDVCK